MIPESHNKAKHASDDPKSELFPRVGELWDCEGRLAFVAGNAIDSDGTIWLFDWKTGDVEYRPFESMTARNDRKTLTDEHIIEHMTGWTGEGNSNAMWWLGWWYEGCNHPKSVWYYVAAMRANPKKHAWAYDRLYLDARSAVMCEGVPKPDLGFLTTIPEMQEYAIGRDWQEALRMAEKADHIPASGQQVSPDQ
jgi:TPR repeat protein